MTNWGVFKRRRRSKKNSFLPDSEYVSQSVRVFLDAGNQITVLKSAATVHVKSDLNVENERVGIVNKRGINGD